MGFFDSVGASLGGTLNRGSAAAQRAARTVRIRNEEAAVRRDRDAAIYQIGEIVYPLLSNHQDLSDLCRGPINAIARADSRIDKLKLELQAIEEEARKEAEAAEAAQALRLANAARKTIVTCPYCGTVIKDNDRFCMGCGRFADEIREIRKAEAAKKAGSYCPRCGTPISASDIFCMGCGEKIARPAKTPTHEDAASKEDSQTGITGDVRQEDGTPPFETDAPIGEAASTESDGLDLSTFSDNETAHDRCCPNCGEPLSALDRFCPSCGSKLDVE